MRIRPKTHDEIDAAICGRYWVWLYAERRKRNGSEPSPEEKRAHPSTAALAAHRARQEAA